jgi:molybdopterin-guanine dinucleotide biosynthesis protein A
VHPSAIIQPGEVTALILAGGRGSRMGGIDKGLQAFQGLPMAQHALRRLQWQQHWVGHIAINANRNLDTYASWGVPVWPDTLSGDLGPLAGFAAGLQQCPSPWMLTVPCDTPLFPLDLVHRLVQAVNEHHADMATAAAKEADGQIRAQPVFCLMRADLRHSLEAFLASGRRKIDAWTGQHSTVLVPFDQAGDDPRAFDNLNTVAELQALEQA